MLFSSPDYPIFLIAVFFLYALSRRSSWANAALMVVLGDIVFTLVAKDPDVIWDPLGGALLRLASLGASDPRAIDWPVALIAHWAVGLCVLFGAIVAGKRGGNWIASDRGQRVIARGIVGVLALVGASVALASANGSLG